MKNKTEVIEGHHYIAITNPDGSCDAIAVMDDPRSGFIAGVLSKFYTDEAKVRELINHGSADYVYPGRYFGAANDGFEPEVMHFDSPDDLYVAIDPIRMASEGDYPEEDLIFLTTHIFIFDNYGVVEDDKPGWSCWYDQSGHDINWAYHDNGEYSASELIEEENEAMKYYKEKGLAQYL